jgi:23S rRNA U2552 (ribose-2'-O)-methylase RlmE/FtsJ
VILYHGSYLPVKKPDISYSRDNVDFGRGFYTTPIREQAVSWAARFKRRRGQSVISAYDLDDAEMRKNVSVLEFDAYSEEWLDFIISCRRGKSTEAFDVVIGGVANDKVFDTIEAFFNGFYGKTQAIKRLQYDKPNLQYCFRNQIVIDDYLKFVVSEVLK